MQLFRTRKGGRRAGAAPDGGGGLAADARAMRAALDDLHSEQQRVRGATSAVELRELVRELLGGEVQAPTGDVAELIRRNTDAGELYERELAPAWEGAGEAQRAARVDGFVELAQMIDAAGEVPGLPREVVHTKALILAWAFDETYGYLPRLGRGEPTK